MYEWQPIESAPKDGTVILLDVGNSTAEAGYWAGEGGGPAQDLADERYPWLVMDPACGGLNAYMEYKVTQWAPMPESPALGVAGPSTAAVKTATCPAHRALGAPAPAATAPLDPTPPIASTSSLVPSRKEGITSRELPAAKEWRGIRPSASKQQRSARVQAVAPLPDTVLLDFIASEYLDVSAFAMPTGADDADVGWKLHQEHMGAKGRIEVACHYRDDLRAAIREAMRALGHTLPDGVVRPDGEAFPRETPMGGKP